jgi:nicotinate-nucleotide adenylyltransferase
VSASETIAVYGGSFDPPHVAHFLVASWIASSTGVDRVLLVPSASHALGKAEHASFEHRLAMCELVAKRIAGAEVSPLESELPRPSRTLPLLESLAIAHPAAKFRLVVGADIANQTERWHRWDAIVALAPPLWVGRVGYPRPVGSLFEFPAVSSTDIRARIAAGKSHAGLLTDEVRAYVAAHDLYRRPVNESA